MDTLSNSTFLTISNSTTTDSSNTRNGALALSQRNTGLNVEYTGFDENLKCQIRLHCTVGLLCAFTTTVAD